VLHKQYTAAVIILSYAENEVDGPTLLGLTETMISRLFPTMRLQVQFTSELEDLKRAVPVTTEHDGTNGQAPSRSKLQSQHSSSVYFEIETTHKNKWHRFVTDHSLSSQPT